MQTTGRHNIHHMPFTLPCTRFAVHIAQMSLVAGDT